ncbi:AMP-dependent synthetase/ligase [Alicyclobacillus tolerans]|uniref:Long-chain acyl-CoA synthetase n=1 Tax=Alicyclobacillus tolerans TaxID=90970 RepID=A0A1M6TES7_9BACL|nr:long-chain fatty acid--CoA ligase [Alicyclobacillus montanus]SHK55473.1 long-chain acyl-CoA synthetase [Alicyclobacillus montanus]
MNLVEMLEASVETHRERVAMQHKVNGQYVALTYEQLWEKILATAAGLQEIGVREGDKVALWAESSPDWAICDFACMAIGAVVAPIYPTLPRDAVTYILQNAEARFLLVGHWKLLEKLMDEENHLPEGLEGTVLLEDLGLARFPSSFPLYALKALQNHGQQRLAASQSPIAQPRPPQEIFPNIPSSALATIVHTSGTSGQPKGVMLTHQNLISNVKAITRVVPVYPEDKALSYLPLSHIFERTVGLFTPLLFGASIAYAESIDTIRDNLLEIRPSILVTVPRLLEKVYAGILENLEHAPKAVRPLLEKGMGERPSPLAHKVVDKLVYSKIRSALGGQMRLVVSGGAGLASNIAKFFSRAGIPIVEGYGMTETAPVIAVNPLEDARPGFVGKPIPGVEVRLAEDGELLVRGPNVMQGYYRQPEATEETIDEEGWLHTGDLAEIIDGYIRIVDRKKNILVLATGKNVAPFPIENALTLSPAVSDAVLIGDGKPYVTCLLVPDFEVLKTRFDDVSDGNTTALLQRPDVLAWLDAEIVKAVAPFAAFERPKRALLLRQPFSMESGELTPTLKVKSRLLTMRYEQEIERMYHSPSKDVLLIGSGGQTGDGDDSEHHDTTDGTAHWIETDAIEDKEPAQENSKPATRSRLRRALFIGGGTLGALVVASGIALAATHPQNVKKLSDELNIGHTLSQIQTHNNGISQNNAQIVKEMDKAGTLSGASAVMNQQLGGLYQGIGKEDKTLQCLNGLSLQEVNLSNSFGQYANSIHGNLLNIAANSSSQNHALSQMNELTQELRQTAARLNEINQEMGGKLNTAKADSQQLANEMP